MATSITTSFGYTYSQLDPKKEKFRLADASLLHNSPPGQLDLSWTKKQPPVN
jgi:hypothetical protein